MLPVHGLHVAGGACQSCSSGLWGGAWNKVRLSSRPCPGACQVLEPKQQDARTSGRFLLAFKGGVVPPGDRPPVELL